jgi:hypothetical protein
VGAGDGADVRVDFGVGRLDRARVNTCPGVRFPATGCTEAVLRQPRSCAVRLASATSAGLPAWCGQSVVEAHPATEENVIPLSMLLPVPP